jgi:hypothetical protein
MKYNEDVLRKQGKEKQQLRCRCGRDPKVLRVTSVQLPKARRRGGEGSSPKSLDKWLVGRAGRAGGREAGSWRQTVGSLKAKSPG